MTEPSPGFAKRVCDRIEEYEAEKNRRVDYHIDFLYDCTYFTTGSFDLSDRVVSSILERFRPIPVDDTNPDISGYYWNPDDAVNDRRRANLYLMRCAVGFLKRMGEDVLQSCPIQVERSDEISEERRRGFEIVKTFPLPLRVARILDRRGFDREEIASALTITVDDVNRLMEKLGGNSK